MSLYDVNQGPGYGDASNFQFAPMQNAAMQYAQKLGAGGALQQPGTISDIGKLVAMYKKKKMMDALNTGGAAVPDWMYNATNIQPTTPGDFPSAGGG